MNEDLHKRAQRLIDKQRVEGLSAGEQKLLEEHLAGCEACAGRARSTDAALRALASVSIAVPAGLASATSLRVRERAAELKQERLRNAALIAGCAVSWLVGVASAPLVWKIFAWLGATFDLPRAVWLTGFALWWFVPAGAAVLLILWQRERAERDSVRAARGDEWRRF